MPLRSGGTFDGFWGDGSDGDVTIGANQNLNAPKQYRNLTISDGFWLDFQALPIYVEDLLTLGNGSFLKADGNAGGNGVVGAGGAAGAAYTPIGTPYSLGGYAGAAGSNGAVGADNLQGFGVTTAPAYGGGGGGGGGGTLHGGFGAVSAANGGARGAALGGTGGNGLVADQNFLLSNYDANIIHPGNLLSAWAGGMVFHSGTWRKPAGGFGGGGGGGGGGAFDGTGGGGGGAAGAAIVVARRIKCVSGLGGITAIGGRGGTGLNATGTGIGGGGGGGGGGGLVVIYYAEIIGSPIFSVAGGVGGVGGTSVGGGNPHGGNGGNGALGRLVLSKM